MEIKLTYWSIITIVILITTGIIIFYGYYILNAIKYYNKRSIELKNNIDRLEEMQEKMILEAEHEIQEETFQYISKEIHDNVIQVLSLAKLNLHELSNKTEIEKKLILENILNGISKSIHDLNNISKSLDSEIINEHGLIASINFEIDKWRKFVKPIISFLYNKNESNLSDIKNLFIFRIFQESLNNSIKHSNAKNIKIKINTQLDYTMLIIEDDGKGFNTEEIYTNKIIGKMSGIKNMRRRTENLDGKFELFSKPNQGTKIIVTIPI